MVTLSTHVLDLSTGQPAEGVQVSLARGGPDAWEPVGDGTTDGDGRIGRLGSELAPGIYRLRFLVGEYGSSFYPHVDVVVRLDADRDHFHVPLLLSPFGYSTYRGS